MRIFIALDIPEEIRQHMANYQDRVRKIAYDARWARVEGLHVTLKFIGEASDAGIQEIKTALAGIKTTPFVVDFTGVGFFPNEKAARIFWIGVNGGEALPKLASSVDAALEKIGFPREDKPYHPHLTLARAGSHPLQELQPLLTDSPQFGTMTARDFFLYQSQPQRGGSRYIRLEQFTLE